MIHKYSLVIGIDKTNKNNYLNRPVFYELTKEISDDPFDDVLVELVCAELDVTFVTEHPNWNKEEKYVDLPIDITILPEEFGGIVDAGDYSELDIVFNNKDNSVFLRIDGCVQANILNLYTLSRSFYAFGSSVIPFKLRVLQE